MQLVKTKQKAHVEERSAPAGTSSWHHRHSAVVVGGARSSCAFDSAFEPAFDPAFGAEADSMPCLQTLVCVRLTPDGIFGAEA